MSKESLLSKEEINTVIRSSAGAGNTKQSGQHQARVRPYDPSSQHRTIRDRLHALEFINERFARNFRVALVELIRRNADITVDSVQYQSFNDFSQEIPGPTNINVVTMRPLRGSALIVFPPSLVFMVVDSLFGGDGRFIVDSEGREFTNTEQRIINRLLRLATNGYGDSWKSIRPLEIKPLRTELHPRFANITSSGNEIVVNTTFTIEIGGKTSKFHVCIPYAMLEPVRDMLINPLSDNQQVDDGSWKNRMAHEVRHSHVDLVAGFTEIASTISEVKSLDVGDVLPLTLPHTVNAAVDGVPIMECDYGSQDDMRALRVRHLFDHANDHEPTSAFINGADMLTPKENT